MRSDLEILVDHLQSEYDYLKLSMDQCIAAQDFDGAKAFLEPMRYTSRKLNVLKSLQNPDFTLIHRLSTSITHWQSILKEQSFKNESLINNKYQSRLDRYNESIKSNISSAKTKLASLKAKEPRIRIDDDQIFNLLDELDQSKINQILFEIRSDKIFLLLNVQNEDATSRFVTKDHKKMSHFLDLTGISILRRLGYDIDTFTKQITNFNSFDKTRFIEELAIIYFEVFRVYGEEINVIVE